jgi:Lhr-like helicase
MEHSQYYHFSSRAHEVTDVVVLPAEGHDHIRCFADQVKMTCALVRDLDEVVKEIKQLGERGEEASWKITELEALCKQQAKAAQNLREEKATLEGKVESRDELIMEIADELDTTTWMRMLTMRKMAVMRMTMTKETLLHPLFLRHLLPPLK